MTSCRSFTLALLCIASLIGARLTAQMPASPSAGPAKHAGSNHANIAPLMQGFLDPPLSARPRVWWHWMNGNISQQGIKLDLDWMHRVGLGGVTIFEGAINTPQGVPNRLVYM